MTISEDVAEQAEQTLRTIASALAEAGASLDDVVRVRYLLPSADDFEACWPVLRRHFGVALPAATMMVVGLADPAHEDRDRGHRPRALLMAPRTDPDASGLRRRVATLTVEGTLTCPWEQPRD